jgi:hypothetical protein
MAGFFSNALLMLMIPHMAVLKVNTRLASRASWQREFGHKVRPESLLHAQAAGQADVADLRDRVLLPRPEVSSDQHVTADRLSRRSVKMGQALG